MLKTFRNILLIAAVFCFARTAHAQALAMSADQTVTYINATLHNYPSLEFVESGCPGYEQTVAISEDRRSLIITQNLGNPVARQCDAVQTLTAPVFNLNLGLLGTWQKEGQHSSFFVDCLERVSCISRRSEIGTSPVPESEWLLHVTAPDLVSDSLGKAIHHL